MTDTGWVIAVSYTAISLVGIVVVLAVFRSTRVGFRVRVADRDTLERREGYWGIIVISFLVLVLAGTIFSVPYWSAEDSNASQTLEITGRQFAFTVDPPQVKADELTQVNVHAADVNHAVGIYSPEGALIKQVNVLPGVTQSFTITFGNPGTYELRCLEFCGIDHHLMQNKLEVK